MTQHSTRKQFFAKLLGLTAVAGLVPNLFAKKAAPAAVLPAAAGEKRRWTVRTDARAVARRESL